MLIKNICGHSFAANLIKPNPLILDCGANRGEFSIWFNRNYDAAIYAFEPDPRLFPKLPVLKQTTFYPNAVSGTGDPLTLRLGETRCSTAFFSEKADQNTAVVDSVRLEQFCMEKNIQNIDLLKLDVEGAEIGVLESLSIGFLSKVGQITVEFHDFIQKSELPDIRKVIDRLKKAGFFYIRFSHYDHSDVLFVNKSLFRLTWFDVLNVYAIKYLRGLKRTTRRMWVSGGQRT